MTDDQRFAAARCAISLRRSGESFCALTFPPFCPPKRPSVTAAGFFCDLRGAPVATSTSHSAFCATPRLLDRLGMTHNATVDATFISNHSTTQPSNQRPSPHGAHNKSKSWTRFAWIMAIRFGQGSPCRLVLLQRYPNPSFQLVDQPFC